MSIAPAAMRWAKRKLRKEDLMSAWNSQWTQTTSSLEHNAEDAAISLRRAATAACDAVAKRSKQPPQHKPQFWWSEEVAEVRKASQRACRLFQRAPLGSELRESKIIQWKEACSSLKKAIRSSKEAEWRQIIAELDRDPWGLAYKIV
ncbi:hypothetical protein PGB90_006324 [Kerria lacca]